MSTRIRFDLVALMLLAATLLPGCVTDTSVTAAAGPERVKTPTDYKTVTANGNVVEMDLWVIEGPAWSPHEGKWVVGFWFSTTPDMSGASIPGPEIRLTQGDTLRVHLHTKGGGGFNQPHTIHWHGIALPWEMDGVPYVTQDAPWEEDATYTYEWVAQQTGTYWYHCHVEAPAHIDIGMFGALIIDPADPSDDPPFDREYTMILHETDSHYFGVFMPLNDPTSPRTTLDPLSSNPFDTADAARAHARTAVDAAAILPGYITGDQTVAPGAEGPRDYYPAFSLRYRPEYDTFMINGKSYPETEPVYIKEGETLRIRLINAGVHPHAMHLHGHHALVTHKDGYRLASPYYADTILIGSGERYDLYVEGDNPGIWDFHSHGGGFRMGGFAQSDWAFPGGMMTMLVYEDFEPVHYVPYHHTGQARAGDYALFAHAHKGQGSGHQHVPPPVVHRTDLNEVHDHTGDALPPEDGPGSDGGDSSDLMDEEVDDHDPLGEDWQQDTIHLPHDPVQTHLVDVPTSP